MNPPQRSRSQWRWLAFVAMAAVVAVAALAAGGALARPANLPLSTSA
jgi:anti-sigma-K factor RskA